MTVFSFASRFLRRIRHAGRGQGFLPSVALVVSVVVERFSFSRRARRAFPGLYFDVRSANSEFRDAWPTGHSDGFHAATN
jgi:hypothetical protein